MKNTYLAIAGRIHRELQELDRVIKRVSHIWQQALRVSDDYYVDATALNLHSIYAGIERLLEVIADGIDRTKPSGANWHQELLRQMTVDLPGVRPAVLRPETCDKLDKYRGFRHVVRNVYTFKLDPEQVALLVKQLPPTMLLARQDLLAFAHFLEQLAQDDEA